MSEVVEQVHRIEDLRSAQYITSTLRDISASEIKGIRGRFERNEQFSRELRELYQLVWTLGEQSGEKMPSNRLDKKLYVAYTTNRHFYGSLNQDVMRRFIQDTGTNDTCLIIGDTGHDIWRSSAKKRKEVSFISFAQDNPNSSETVGFINRINEYDRVFVYYPGFVSVFAQEPQILDVSFRPDKKDRIHKVDQKSMESDIMQIEFLLEPDIAEMIVFFNSQVRYALFERLLLETELSRVAARLVKMDTADQNTNVLIASEQSALRHAQASFSSRRMIETVVGYLQWHTRKI